MSTLCSEKPQAAIPQNYRKLRRPIVHISLDVTKNQSRLTHEKCTQEPQVMGMGRKGIHICCPGAAVLFLLSWGWTKTTWCTALKALTTSSLQKCALAVTAATMDGGLTSGPQARDSIEDWMWWLDILVCTKWLIRTPILSKMSKRVGLVTEFSFSPWKIRTYPRWEPTKMNAVYVFGPSCLARFPTGTRSWGGSGLRGVHWDRRGPIFCLKSSWSFFFDVFILNEYPHAQLASSTT